MGPPTFDDTGGYGQYTVEGEINQLGSFARGAWRARGPKGVLGKILLAWLIFGAVNVPIVLLIYVIHALIERHGL